MLNHFLNGKKGKNFPKTCGAKKDGWQLDGILWCNVNFALFY